MSAAGRSSLLREGLEPVVGRRRDPWVATLAAAAGRLRQGGVMLVLPDGGAIDTGADDASGLRAVVHLKHARAARRLVLGGAIGFAEAYIDGDWDSPDLSAVLEIGIRNEAALHDAVGGLAPIRRLHRLAHLLNANTRRGSRRNIASHYDLGNAFYRLWLDPGMTYSSAMFEGDDDDFGRAQDRKYRALAAALDLRSGQRVLEIGCGWGAFAELAARDYGCRVTAVTLSREQADYAGARIRAAGLADRVEIRQQDYRDVEGVFDRIASIEMLEAVGEAYWSRFFATLHDRLRPGGAAALQVITIADDRFEAYRRNADFIQRHVFPGGMLPSPAVLSRQVEVAGLRLTGRRMFGACYARTLRIWHRRFAAAWPDIARLGFDERFRRLWTYYLVYCEVGFRVGSIDVGQFRIEKPGG
jgi:cyclopropane-fatty-acyl-phospholipid synthase